MTESKFRFSVYLVFFMIPVLWAFPVYLLLHPDTVIKSKFGDENSAAFLGVFLLFFGLLLAFIYARILYFIKVEDKTIIIKGVFKIKQIELSEIRLINLFSKENFYWTTGIVGIATRIELNNSDKIIIADFFYRNIHLIKQSIAENFKEKIQPQLLERKSRSTQTDIESDFEKFAGNPHTSFNSLVIYGIVVFILAIIFISKVQLKPAHFALLFPIAAFYAGFGAQLNYFLISNNRLVVKNHFLFWINKIYDVTDIAAADFESPYRRSKALRIITKDFKSKLFCAGSLRDKNWLELKEKFKTLQIYFVD